MIERDVDDPAVAAVEHVLQDRPGQVERAGQVDVQHLVPVFGGHLAHRLVDGDTGVVDQDVELAVLVEHLPDDALAVLVRADVALVHAWRRGASSTNFSAASWLPRVAGGDLDAAARTAAR